MSKNEKNELGNVQHKLNFAELCAPTHNQFELENQTKK
jgi:hypothetical protein